MSGTISLPQRDDWQSFLTEPECIERLSACAVHWDPERRLTRNQIELLATRMTAKEYAPGQPIADEEMTKHQVVWILAGNVRVVQSGIPSFQVSKGHIVGAKNYFSRDSDSPRCFADTACVCGVLSHSDVDALGLVSLVRVLGHHSALMADRVIVYKQGQVDSAREKEQEKEREREHKMVREEEAEKRKRDKDKIARNIQELAALQRARDSEKVPRVQFEELVNKYVAAQMASGEALRANGVLRQELESVKQARDQLQSEVARLAHDKKHLEQLAHGLKVDLSGERRRREASESECARERRRREEAEEMVSWAGKEREMEMGVREQALLVERSKWKDCAHQLQAALATLAENAGRETTALERRLAAALAQGRDWEAAAAVTRDTSARALADWRAHTDKLSEINKQLSDDLAVARRMHQAAAADRDGLEQRVRQLKGTVKQLTDRDAQYRLQLLRVRGVLTSAKRQLAVVARQMARDVMGAAVKLWLIRRRTSLLSQALAGVVAHAAESLTALPPAPASTPVLSSTAFDAMSPQRSADGAAAGDVELEATPASLTAAAARLRRVRVVGDRGWVHTRTDALLTEAMRALPLVQGALVAWVTHANNLTNGHKVNHAGANDVLSAAARRTLDRELQRCRAAALVGLQARGESTLSGAGREWSGALQGWSLANAGSRGKARSRAAALWRERGRGSTAEGADMEASSEAREMGADAAASNNHAGAGLASPRDLFAEDAPSSDEEELRLPSVLPHLALPVPPLQMRKGEAGDAGPDSGGGLGRTGGGLAGWALDATGRGRLSVRDVDGAGIREGEAGKAVPRKGKGVGISDGAFTTLHRQTLTEVGMFGTNSNKPS